MKRYLFLTNNEEMKRKNVTKATQEIQNWHVVIYGIKFRIIRYIFDIKRLKLEGIYFMIDVHAGLQAIL